MSSESQGTWGERGYVPLPDTWNVISGKVIRCAIEVHRTLGPGLLERLYEDALSHELTLAGLSFKRQYPIRLRYKGIELSEQRLDLVVEDLIILELKAVEAVPDVYLAQLVSYMRSADMPLGLLINFNCNLLKQGLYRRINPHATALRSLPPPSESPQPLSVTSGSSEFIDD